MDDEPGRHVRLGYAHPQMVKLVAAAGALWGVGVPVVLAIKLGDLRLLLIAPFGLLLVPVVLMLSTFGRIMLWVQLVLFWYIRGVAAVLAMLAFAGLSCAVLTLPVPYLDELAPRLTAGLPSNAVAIGALLLLLMAIAGGAAVVVRRHWPARDVGGSLNKSPKLSPGGRGAASPPLIPPTPAPRPLTYLQHRGDKTP